MRPRIDFGELAPLRQERLDIVEAGVRYIDRLEGLGRKKTTISDYRSMLRVHLIPFFGGRSLDGISVELVESFIPRSSGRESAEVDLELSRPALLDLRVRREAWLDALESGRARGEAAGRASRRRNPLPRTR